MREIDGYRTKRVRWNAAGHAFWLSDHELRADGSWRAYERNVSSGQ